MARCDHAAWLELWQGEAGPLLSHGWRLPQIVKGLPNPSEQSPQITFFLGRHLKEKALRTPCDSNYKWPRRKHAVNIRTDNRTLNALHPRLFADCDPALQSLQPMTAGNRDCYQDHILSIGELPRDRSLYDAILSRLLFMFVDVICCFADDLGGLDAVRDILSVWLRIGSGSSRYKLVYHLGKWLYRQVRSRQIHRLYSQIITAQHPTESNRVCYLKLFLLS